MPFDPEYTVLNSRLADGFGKACADAAKADKVKADYRQRILDYVARQGVGKALFVGTEFDVTVSVTSSSTVDWEAVARELADRLQMSPKCLQNLVRQHETSRVSPRVAAKARVERGE